MPTISPPSSWTNVANDALALLGAQPITNIYVDTAPNAVRCRSLIGAAVRNIMDEHDWRSNTARVALSLLTDAPAFGYLYAYQIPSDCVRPYGPETGGVEYTIEQDKLLTDAEEVYLAYVPFPGEPTLLPHNLIQAIECELALLLAPAMKGSNEQSVQRIAAMRSKALNAALGSDGVRKPQNDTLGHVWSDELRT